MTLDVPTSGSTEKPSALSTLAQYVKYPERLKGIREMPVNFNYQAVFCLGCGEPETNIKRSEYAAELALKKTVPYLVSGGMVSKAHRKLGMTEADQAYAHIMAIPYYKELFEKHKIHFERETKARSTAANINNVISYLRQNGITRILIVTDQTFHAKRAIGRLKKLYPQVVVSFYTPANPNIDSNISRGEMADVSPNEGTEIALQAVSDLPAQKLLRTPAEEAAPLPPPGSMHGTVLEKVTGIAEDVATKDLETISSVPIKELRSSKIILEEQKEDKKEKALSVKAETARRIKAYTNEQNGEWYKLDYSKLDRLKKDEAEGWTHEMDVGLGEILMDPDITDILIENNSRTIRAHRGIVPSGQNSAGRVAFLDENNRYVATYSGDRFRILRDGETDLEKSTDEYIAKYDEESKARDTHSQSVAKLHEPPDPEPDSDSEASTSVASASATSASDKKADLDKEDPEDEGGGPAPTALDYASTPGSKRLELGSSQSPYRFFATSVKNQSGKEILVTNGGAPGVITLHTKKGEKRETFKDNLAKSQLRALYERGIRVVVSLDEIPEMERVIPKLRQEGVNMELISKKYSCSNPPSSDNLTLFEEVASRIRNGKSVYIHCKHGAHRGPSCTAGVLIASGIAKSFAHSLQLASLDPVLFRRTDERRAMIKQLADFARSKGLKVESAAEYAKYTSNKRNINIYREILG